MYSRVEDSIVYEEENILVFSTKYKYGGLFISFIHASRY